jgi:Spy/CpxP family protein refolding chaperone
MIDPMERSMKWALATIALVLAAPAFAQSPYAGLQSRPIKALSEQQVGDLKNGRGMGLALAAELNGYPGPSHVIELADKLKLTPEQRRRVEQLFAAMKQEALPLGARLLEQEAALDRDFARRTVTPERLRSATAAIAQTQGSLREAHLKYHLLMTSILTPEQVHRYKVIRGYAGNSGHAH